MFVDQIDANSHGKYEVVTAHNHVIHFYLPGEGVVGMTIESDKVKIQATTEIDPVTFRIKVGESPTVFKRERSVPSRLEGEHFSEVISIEKLTDNTY